MFSKIRIFITNYRKKRFIRKELAKKYKQFKPTGIMGKLNPTTNIPRERRIQELTESIYHASKIVKKQVDEQTTAVSNHSKEALLNKLKNVIDNHYGEIDKENQELKLKLKESILKTNKYYIANKKIKEAIKGSGETI